MLRPRSANSTRCPSRGDETRHHAYQQQQRGDSAEHHWIPRLHVEQNEAHHLCDAERKKQPGDETDADLDHALPENHPDDVARLSA